MSYTRIIKIVMVKCSNFATSLISFFFFKFLFPVLKVCIYSNITMFMTFLLSRYFSFSVNHDSSNSSSKVVLRNNIFQNPLEETFMRFQNRTKPLRITALWFKILSMVKLLKTLSFKTSEINS